MDIFGRFRLIIGLFLIEYEDFGPETCTKHVRILGEAFYVLCSMYAAQFDSSSCTSSNKLVFGRTKTSKKPFFQKSTSVESRKKRANPI